MKLKYYFLYGLVFAYIASFLSTLVISIMLATGKKIVTNNVERRDPHDSQHEEPILGVFGPISTVIILIAIPFLILISTIAYAFYLRTTDREEFMKIFMGSKKIK